MGFFTFFNHFFTDSGELTYTLSEAVEKIGFGKFQIRILLMVGFFTVSVVLYLLDVLTVSGAMLQVWGANMAQIIKCRGRVERQGKWSI